MNTQVLEHYEDLADIKRVIVHTATLNPDVGHWVYFYVSFTQLCC